MRWPASGSIMSAGWRWAQCRSPVRSRNSRFMRGKPIQAFFVRKKPKDHGARLAVEGLAPGESLAGKRVVIVEDVTTTGGSAVKAVDAVRELGADIVMVFTMVDREEGATDTFREAGLDFRSLYKAAEFLKG